MKVTAKANTNIALVKYWGKRNEKLILPHNNSISVTCDGLFTIATVEFSPKYRRDVIILNGQKVKENEKNIFGHLEKIRKMAKIKEKAKIVSQSNFPLSAGLASSASGLAAITLAATKAANLNLNQKQLSILARQGSGSASRSIFGGFVEWLRGKKEDGSDSYARQIVNENYWPEFRMVFVILTKEKKEVGSRSAMAQTVKSCPYYQGWLKTVNEDLKKIREGILKKNLSLVGLQAEENCLKMHALLLATKPPIIFWQPETIEVIKSVFSWRKEGIECYFTIDAGSNVVLISLAKDLPEIKKRLKKIEAKEIIVSKPGEGAKLIAEDLF
jgi:diphosphomevalonate decarboxylase